MKPYIPVVHIHTKECWKAPVNDECYLFYISVLQNELLVIQETLRPLKAKIDRIHTDIQHLKIEDTHGSQEETTEEKAGARIPRNSG